MNFYDVLLLKKLQDDRDPKIEGLSVTENGTYSEDNVVYNPVIVNVPTPTLTSITYTANGNYEAPTGTAYTTVITNVQVPQDAYIEDNASGASVTVTAKDAPLTECKITVTPSQQGTGTPSSQNIRPINKYSIATVTVNSTATTFNLNDDICGGVIDASGNTNKTWGYIASYDGEVLPGEWLSDRDEYAPNTTPTIGAEVAYEITPVDVAFQPVQIRTETGSNVISANCGDIAIKYMR